MCSLRRSLPLLLLLSAAGCSGGGGKKTFDGVVGSAQKGPYALASTVTLQEVDGNLTPTGRSYTVQTEDELGTFAVPETIHTRYVEVLADGYFFDELAGSVSTAELGLHAYCDLEQDDICNVNIATTLVGERAQSLFLDGAGLADATAQATQELFPAFHIDATNFFAPDDMDIATSGDSNAALLAASLMVLQVAHDEEPMAPVPQLQQFLASLALDLKDDGLIDDAGTLQALALAPLYLDAPFARAGLEQLYGSTMPPFEEFLDSDWDGLLDSVDSDLRPAGTIVGPLGGEFGAGLAVSGTRIFVGNPQMASNGAVVEVDEAGTHLDPIIYSPGASGFGKRLAASSTHLGVSAYGTAYLYDLSTGGLVVSATSPVGPIANYPTSVAVVGTALLVASELANTNGEVYLFDTQTGAVARTFVPPGTTSSFGRSLLPISGGRLAVGAPTSNSVFLFDLASGAYLATLTPPGGVVGFGRSIAESGGVLAIGANNHPMIALSQGIPQPGSVHLFDATSLILISSIDDPSSDQAADGDAFGDSILFTENSIVIGSPMHYTFTDDGYFGFEGQAELFDRVTGDSLALIPNPSVGLAAKNAAFGNAMAILPSGDVAISAQKGPVRIFEIP